MQDTHRTDGTVLTLTGLIDEALVHAIVQLSETREPTRIDLRRGRLRVDARAALRIGQRVLAERTRRNATATPRRVTLCATRAQSDRLAHLGAALAPAGIELLVDTNLEPGVPAA